MGIKLTSQHKLLAKDKDTLERTKIDHDGDGDGVKENSMFNLKEFLGDIEQFSSNTFKTCIVDIWFLATQYHLINNNSHWYIFDDSLIPLNLSETSTASGLLNYNSRYILIFA